MHSESAGKKTEVEQNQARFVLTAEQWDKFCAALAAPPVLKPALKKLLTTPSVFDQRG